jgi:hypothetical protein
MQAITAIAAKDSSMGRDAILDHIVECHTCLSIIVDLDLPTSACEARCMQLSDLLDAASCRF